MLFTRLSGASRQTAPWLPSQCAVCHAWPAERICTDCAARFAAPVHRCAGCAQRVPEPLARCGTCLRHPLALDTCVAAVDYAYPWDGLLTQFKFHADPGAARSLAALMRRAAEHGGVLGPDTVLVPLPLARGRLRQRGYNQALLLARALRHGGPVQPHWLVRLRETPAQSALPRAERLRNLHGAFSVPTAAQAALTQQRLLLVDDVMTTGATLHAAATALRAAGARHVDALVLARTP
ncbi:MAG: phosphoribosyltransferase family protein [Comamonadaceae bacterium]|nr:ComF family protein [Burkholderiales bacterium]MEB2348705.1 phosphoribosyltransferase family protein [Comamonadaceae bacterium]